MLKGRKGWRTTKQREPRTAARRFWLGAAIGAGTTGGLVVLLYLCFYAWFAVKSGDMRDNPLPILTAWFLSIGWILALGGIVISALLVALLFGSVRTRTAIVVCLSVAAVTSCGLAGTTLPWYLFMPRPSPPPYPNIEAQSECEKLEWGEANTSCTYEVSLPLLAMRQYYENQMTRYCKDAWKFAATPESNFTCYEAHCQIGPMQYFEVRLCDIDGERTRVVHEDWMED